MKEYEAVVTWDDQKNKTNIKKHNGISFELAQYAFLDECMLVEEAGVVDNEQRWSGMGKVTSPSGQHTVVLLVIHTYEDDKGQEYIRIISARKALSHEVKRYEAKKSTKRG